MELDICAIFFADPQLALKIGGGGKKKIDAVTECILYFAETKIFLD